MGANSYDWQNTKGLPMTFDGNKQEVVQPVRFLPGTFSLPAPLSCTLNGSLGRILPGDRRQIYTQRSNSQWLHWMEWNFPSLLLLAARTARMNSIPGQQPWLSTLALPGDTRWPYPENLWGTHRTVENKAKQTDTAADGSKRKQWGKTEQTQKQPAQLPLALIMGSFDFLSSSFFAVFIFFFNHKVGVW